MMLQIKQCIVPAFNRRGLPKAATYGQGVVQTPLHQQVEKTRLSDVFLGNKEC